MIELLLEFKWWDLPPEKLVTVLPLLCDFDLEKVTKKIKEIYEEIQKRLFYMINKTNLIIIYPYLRN